MSPLKGFIGALLCGLVTECCVFMTTRSPFLSNYYHGGLHSWLYTLPSNCVAAILLLLGSLSVKIRSDYAIRLLRIMAGSAFGVYLIHINPKVLERFFRGAFAGFSELPLWAIIPFVLLSVVAIYIGCSMCDYIRAWLFKRLKTLWLEKHESL